MQDGSGRAFIQKGQRSAVPVVLHRSVLTDNRYALVVDADVTPATGTAEVDAALTMLNRRPGKRRLTVTADKNYDQRRFIAGARQANLTPHVARNTRRRRSRIDGRTTRHAGYAKSINARHRVQTRLAGASSTDRSSKPLNRPGFPGGSWV